MAKKANNETIQALIPAAGVGTRLRPQTHNKPKALVSVGGKPIISHIIEAVISHGIKDIVIIIGYFGEKIKQYVPRAHPDVKFTFVEQKHRKGLGHAIGMAKDLIHNPVLIVYGDTLFEGDIKPAFKPGTDGSLGTKVVDDPRRFGIVEKEGQYAKKLIEKPNFIRTSEVLVGVNFIRNYKMMFKAIDYLIENNITLKGEYQITHAFQKMVDWGAKLTTFEIDNWFDCGTSQALLETNQHILKKHSTTKNPVIVKDNILIPPVFISKKAKIHHSIIGPYVSVADDSEISHSIIKNSIVNNGATIKDINIINSIIGHDSFTQATPYQVNIGDDSKLLFNQSD